MAAIGAVCGACSDGGLGGDDQDGIVGGNYTFRVTATDSAFAPAILKAQNQATVKVTLENTGTKPHGFAIGCLGTACFPHEATIPSVDPGATGTSTFQTPHMEGIYVIGSPISDDALSGQFIVE